MRQAFFLVVCILAMLSESTNAEETKISNNRTDVTLLYSKEGINYYVSKKPATVGQAEKICQSIGENFHLISFEGRKEFKTLLQYMRGLDTETSRKLWTSGLYDPRPNAPSQYLWSRPSPSFPMSFVNFHARNNERFARLTLPNPSRPKCRNGYLEPPCKPPNCTVELPECTTETIPCVIDEEKPCFVERPDCHASCNNCTIVKPPVCHVFEKPCHVETPQCEVYPKSCTVVTPPCNTTRGECEIQHPPCYPAPVKPCTTTTPKPCCQLTRPPKCLEGNCPPLTTTIKCSICLEPIICQPEPVICPTPIVVCPPEETVCPPPQLDCPNPTVVCNQPEVICPEPEVRCDDPVVECEAPIVSCPQAVVSCPSPGYDCPEPEINCPDPILHCDEPPPCEYPEVPEPCPEPCDDCNTTTTTTTTEKPEDPGCICLDRKEDFAMDVDKCNKEYHFICEGANDEVNVNISETKFGY